MFVDPIRDSSENCATAEDVANNEINFLEMGSNPMSENFAKLYQATQQKPTRQYTLKNSPIR